MPLFITILSGRNIFPVSVSKNSLSFFTEISVAKKGASSGCNTIFSIIFLIDKAVSLFNKPRNSNALTTCFTSDAEIISTFYHTCEVKVKDTDKLIGAYLLEPIIEAGTGAILIDSSKPLTKEAIKTLGKLKMKSVRVVLSEDIQDGGLLFNTIKLDETCSTKEAVKELRGIFRLTDYAGKAIIEDIIGYVFGDPHHYSLGKVGRFRMNSRLGVDLPPDMIQLTQQDVIATVKYIIALASGKGYVDDVDHLSVRRVRTVGELVSAQLRIGLARLAHSAREKMRSFKSKDKVNPMDIVNVRPVTAALNSFFGAGQLSQFADETNPLSLLTHCRRLSALGPGGLTREGAGFEVRDVHYTHYGRMCPIETPEGQNIGLITSLTVCSQINELGFIETPCKKVTNGKVASEIVYLDAQEEDKHTIASLQTFMEGTRQVLARRKGDIVLVYNNAGFPQGGFRIFPGYSRPGQINQD